MSLLAVKQAIKNLANPSYAQLAARYFKTGPGEYAEGDHFWGIRVPELRKLAKQYQQLALTDVEKLLQSHVHEERLVALYLLVSHFQKAPPTEQKKIVDFYLNSTTWINNWDLVDTSAGKIIGQYLLEQDRAVLYRLAESALLWDRRIAIIATQAFIAQGQFEDTLKIIQKLLGDKHDLIHKACGWMLREIGKKSTLVLTQFLDQFADQMPRTMLRYAIEKLSPTQRAQYLMIKPKF